MSQAAGPPSRRAFLGRAGVLAVGAGLSACTGSDAAREHSSGTAEPSGDATSGPAGSAAAAANAAASAPSPVPAMGHHQAGVVSPDRPQLNLLLAVFAVRGSSPRVLLADLGRAVVAMTTGHDPRLAGLVPGDLTVTIGVGPRLVAAVDPSLPGAAELPTFSRETIAASARGGDLMVQVCASDALLLPVAMAALVATAAGRMTERWRQRAARGPYVEVTPTLAAPRNVAGFVDGIVGPHSSEDLDEGVWLAAPARLAGATIAVVRRMELDLGRFAGLPVGEQEAVFGRRRASAVPLSGGSIATDPDLGAKTRDGRYVIPAGAHLRRANALATGVPQMLRRSYSIDDPGAGLLFISFQNALHTFTATLNRMDGVDALLTYTRTTGAGTFLILPGFSSAQPLGATLFGATGSGR